MSNQARKAGTDDLPQLKLENQLCFPLYAAWETGTATVGELCRRLYLDCGTLTPLLKKLEESGWITRSRNREDERVVTVTLTERGWELREEAADVPDKVCGCARIPADEAGQLRALLQSLLEKMN